MFKNKAVLIFSLLFIFSNLIASAISNDSIEQIPSIRNKAILASVIVPGWGQRMLKNNLKSEIMLWTDGAIWLTYSGFTWYGYSRNSDAKLFAGINANANTKIKSDKYYRAIERYNNTGEYNEDIRREARERYPDDPLAQNDYILENGFWGDSTWKWSNDSLRFVYWQKRKSARTAFIRARFVLGAALLNRLISVIDCAFFTPDKRSRVAFVPNLETPGIGIVYRF